MEPYFQERCFVEELVLLPKYLDVGLINTIKILLMNKYPKTYHNYGFIFNIRNIEVLDNKITLSDQIILKVKFKVDLYVPQNNHVFYGELKQGLINKYQWVEIGPLTIFIVSSPQDVPPDKLVKVRITNIKSDNTVCFGEIIN